MEKWQSKHLHLLSTDAVRARLNSRWIDAIICAVDKEHAELKNWLPWPPIALVILATKLVTPFGILSHFEVNGIFLWECQYAWVSPTISNKLNFDSTNLTLAIYIALICLRDVHHLLILSFSVLYKRQVKEKVFESLCVYHELLPVQRRDSGQA